ncbi:MAG TPA: hypothetical protein VHK90_08940, partial [Thermoanaerobaculia bacterium]|nr:hypothetical protein [Thermoanaerobaculia bacterium]
MKRVTLMLFVVMMLVAAFAGAQEKIAIGPRMADEPFTIEGDEWIDHEAFVNAGRRCQTVHPDESEAARIEHAFMESLL